MLPGDHAVYTSRVIAVHASDEVEQVAFARVEEMVYLVHVAVVFIFLLPFGAKAFFPEQHCEGLCNPIAQGHVGRNVDSFLTGGDEPPAMVVGDISRVGIQVLAAVEADRVFGVRLHEVDLFLKLLRVGPIIVSFATGNIFPSCTGVVEDNIHAAFVSVGIFVFCFVEWENLVRVL